MPIGSYAVVPYLAHALAVHKPHTVLDLGIGFGGGGAIVREWLDLGVQPWKTFLAGVEVWPDYRGPLWDLYNVVLTDSIENYLARAVDVFDCVMLNDVLEHFEKPTGRALLAAIQRRVAPGGMILVSTPFEFFEQGAVYGNEYERHRSLWSSDELAGLGFDVEIVGRPDFLCGRALFARWNVTQK
jgi:SAM-dependent methyltransferase